VRDKAWLFSLSYSDMLTLLILSVSLSLLVAFVCSVVEAALFAVPMTYVQQLAYTGGRAGRVLQQLKRDVERPITAILILSSGANTIGATVAGAVAGDMWGELGLILFSATFSILVLYIAEVSPKVIGVRYAKQVAIFAAIPLSFLVKLFSPLIWVSVQISKRLHFGASAPQVSHEEVLALAQLGTREGSLDKLEGSVIHNVIGLDKKIVRDVLTPRVVVFRVPEDKTLGDISSSILEWEYTRVPIYNEAEPEHLTGYVRQRDLYREIVSGNKNATLKDLARPLTAVPELARLDNILLKMFEYNEHICSVVDEHGGLAGIVTLEDILEEVVGHEIVDEYDQDDKAK
jgi:CBS domain containing-hemolysin-like protein